MLIHDEKLLILIDYLLENPNSSFEDIMIKLAKSFNFKSIYLLFHHIPNNKSEVFILNNKHKINIYKKSSSELYKFLSLEGNYELALTMTNRSTSFGSIFIKRSDVKQLPNESLQSLKRLIPLLSNQIYLSYTESEDIFDQEIIHNFFKLHTIVTARI